MQRLILPIMSSCNKQTGKYRVLADGNWLAAFSRFEQMLLDKHATIAVPCLAQWDTVDMHEALKAFAILGLDEQSFLHVRYGKSIQNTRQEFWDLQSDNVLRIIENSLYATGIALPKNMQGTNIYMLNVSKECDQDNRPCAEFFDKDIGTIAKCKIALLHDGGQLLYIADKYPELADKCKIDRPNASKKLLENIGTRNMPILDNTIVLPFRLNDPLYDLMSPDASSFLQYANALGKICIATNPTDVPTGAETAFLNRHEVVQLYCKDKASFLGLLYNADLVVLPDASVWHMLPQEMHALSLSHKLARSWHEATQMLVK